ncbi:hypothetical protein BUALT_Bualt15G0046700 [Buddleja alternifolia]|uniref:PUM-HD domain-containing protein n=1 Tax=Buddleja alternifolia TaxID=168488 RepID=A0AAV6WHX5_9LAMI|nr:hypothetical protein BUALT_Bualt15G0046700 [Buddleja alternifolia]
MDDNLDQWLTANNNNTAASAAAAASLWSNVYNPYLTQNLAPMSTNNVHMNPNLLDFDYPLESEFNRLSLSAAPQSPAFMSPPPPPPLGLDSYSPRNIPNGIGMSYLQPSDSEIRRIRAHYAARMAGLNSQTPNYMAGFVPVDEDSLSFLDAYSSFENRRRARILNHHMNRNGANQFSDSNNSLSDLSNGHRSRQRLNYSSLEEVRGRIFMVAKDQLGCRFLQTKFEQGNPEEIHMIFSEIKDHISELMMDQFGNYLVQKFFEVCNEDQLTQILLLVISDERNLMAICLDMHGTRAMQYLIEHLRTPEQKSLVTSALRRIVVTLTKNPNGHHVVAHCLKLFSTEENKQILNVIADNCLDIAIDKNGCCVIQQCVAHADGEPQQRLVAEITSNALVLNYVVQYILGLNIPRVTSDIMAQLSGNFVSLSMNKYGSNVVEKCLKESEGNQVYQIIEEMIRSPKFLRLLQDPYGNYVAQSALSMAKEKSNISSLHVWKRSKTPRPDPDPDPKLRVYAVDPVFEPIGSATGSGPAIHMENEFLHVAKRASCVYDHLVSSRLLSCERVVGYLVCDVYFYVRRSLLFYD